MKQAFNELLLPGSFIKKITSVFPEGADWLGQLPELFEYCAGQWQLSRFELATNLSYNFICFAESEIYGQAVLKIGVPHDDIYVQMDSIGCFDRKYVCQLFAEDREHCAVLLERISPGNDLTSVQSLKERAAIAAPLIKHIPVTVFDDGRFPTYAGWLDTAFTKLKSSRPAQLELLQLADRAAGLFKLLPTGGKRLLHGDLHHFNIIFDRRHNKWKAIDPHGVIGYFALEAGRFIGNQMGMEANVDDARESLLFLSGVFAKALDIPPSTIMCCAFIDIVLSTCWTTEEVVPDEAEISKGITFARVIDRLVKT